MDSKKVIDRIKVVKADITCLKVDAIVNAANHDLIGGSGVNGAIHQAAGPQLLSACQALQGCDTGKAKFTSGFNLKAKFIIHTVGPKWYGGTYRENDLLESCYQESLKLAASLNCKTIAFPAISCGIYNYPVTEAAEVTLRAMTQFLKSDNLIKRVLITCIDQDVYEIYREIYYRYRQQEYKQVIDWTQSSPKEMTEKKKQVKDLLQSVVGPAAPLKKSKSSFGSLFRSSEDQGKQ